MKNIRQTKHIKHIKHDGESFRKFLRKEQRQRKEKFFTCLELLMFRNEERRYKYYEAYRSPINDLEV